MNKKLYTLLLTLSPLHLFGMEEGLSNPTPVPNASNSKIVTLISNESNNPGQYKITENAVQFSDLLKSCLSHEMKEKKDKKITLRHEYCNNEVTELLVDFLTSLENNNKDEDTLSFFETIKKVTSEKNSENNDNKEAFKEILTFLQLNQKGCQAIATHFQRSRNNPSRYAHFNPQLSAFIKSILPSDYQEIFSKNISNFLNFLAVAIAPKACLSATSPIAHTENLLICGSSDGTITYWDLAAPENSEPIATLKNPNKQIKECKIYNSMLIVWYYDEIKIWSLLARGNGIQPIASINNDYFRRTDHLVIEKDLLLFESGRNIKGWDLSSSIGNAAPAAIFTGHTNLIEVFCVDTKREILICGSRDRTIKLWNLKKRGNDIQPIATLNGHTLRITHLLVHDDILVSASDDRTFKCWDLKQIDKSEPIATFIGREPRAIKQLLITNNRLVSNTYGQGDIQLWDLTKRGNNIKPVAICERPDHGDSTIFIHNNLLIVGFDFCIRIWDSAAWGQRILPLFIIDNFVGPIRNNIEIKNNLLITATSKNTIETREINDGKNMPLIATFVSNRSRICSVNVLGEFLITKSDDNNTLAYWDLCARGNNIQSIGQVKRHPFDQLTIMQSKKIVFYSYTTLDLNSSLKLKNYFSKDLTFIELCLLHAISSAHEKEVKISLAELQKKQLNDLILKLKAVIGEQGINALLERLKKYVTQIN